MKLIYVLYLLLFLSYLISMIEVEGALLAPVAWLLSKILPKQENDREKIIKWLETKRKINTIG